MQLEQIKAGMKAKINELGAKLRANDFKKYCAQYSIIKYLTSIFLYRHQGVLIGYVDYGNTCPVFIVKTLSMPDAEIVFTNVLSMPANCEILDWQDMPVETYEKIALMSEIAVAECLCKIQEAKLKEMADMEAKKMLIVQNWAKTEDKQ